MSAANLADLAFDQYTALVAAQPRQGAHCGSSHQAESAAAEEGALMDSLTLLMRTFATLVATTNPFVLFAFAFVFGYGVSSCVQAYWIARDWKRRQQQREAAFLDQHTRGPRR